jgi:glycosyltransferase involved in cell wall biosynthesis
MILALREAQRQPSPRQVRQLLLSRNEQERVTGILLRACGYYEQGLYPDALRFLVKSRSRIGYYPLPVISNIVWLCTRTNQPQQAAGPCIRFAADALRMGYSDLALEACAGAMILDARGDYEITRNPTACREIADMYEQVFRNAGLPHPSHTSAHPAGSRIRVALIVPNLVDHIVAYTRRVLHFARYHNREQYLLFVYTSENHSERIQPLFPVGCSGNSRARGRETIAELAALDIPVFLTPRNQSFTRSGHALARQLENDGIDVAIFQSGLSAPIDWLAARMAAVPVKVSIHIGSSMMVPGMDATFFDNPANIARENNVWTPSFGERRIRLKGADRQALYQHPPQSRASWGIPAESILIGTMSNHLARRLTPAYLEIIARLLHAVPNAWFVAFGAKPPRETSAFFEQAGVADRVIFAGAQQHPGAVLRMLDIYSAEFPVSGSQSVIEAMNCGIPVVAMHCSDTHAESAAAHIAGPDGAIPRYDTDAYYQRLLSWSINPAARKHAATQMRQRAETLFSARHYVDDILSAGRELLRGKRTQPISPLFPESTVPIPTNNKGHAIHDRKSQYSQRTQPV